MLSAKLKEAAGNGLASTLYVDDVFSTYLYTGNGSTQTITNGIDLAGQGGMTWIKSRSAATDHKLTDTIRGATKALISDTTGAQTTDANGLTAFSSTGFSIGTDSVYNTIAATYASWTFRKAAKFFDVVTYTGNGVAGRSIAHSLGVAPGMVIVKNITGAAAWAIYSNGLGATKCIFLNATNPADTNSVYWNNTNPTDLVFTVGSGATTNQNGDNYVAYLFAHDTASDGIIQCGSYTGNGSTTGPVVSLGWEPQYLMVKNASGTGNWQILDSMRGMPVGSADATIQANLSNAESSIEYLSPTATGFQITSTSTEVNTSGATYIYMAIRRPNKPPTSGTQVFSSTVYTKSNANYRVIDTTIVSDMVFQKQTSGTVFTWGCYDRLRGVTLLYPDTTQAATTTLLYNEGYVYSSESLQTAVLGSSTSDAIMNDGSATAVIYSFKRAPAFFDVVVFTASGFTADVTHNLTVAPEFIIQKRVSGAGDWKVAVNIQSSTYGSLIQNSTSALVSKSYGTGFMLTSQPNTSTVYFDNTSSGQTYVAYLFATLAGISKVGSYTGNGTTQTINCGFTGGARFVLIKRTDSTGDWYVFDTARGMTTLTDPYLLLNSTAAEVATLGAVTSVTTGFAVNAAIVAAINTNAASYIFLAIA